MKAISPTPLVFLLVLGFLLSFNLKSEIIFSDAFDHDGLNNEIWSEIVSNGLTYDQNEKGATVSISDGKLILTQNATDAGGAIISRPFSVESEETVIIQKRTRLHYANRNFRGLTALVEATSRRPVLQVLYLNYTSGFTANDFALGDHSTGARLPPVWDEWFDERITYTPKTGRYTLQVNDGPVVELYRDLDLHDGNYRITMTPYGWFTGHTQEIDSITVETVLNDLDQDGLPDAWEWELIDGDPDDELTSLDSLTGQGDLDFDGLNNVEEYRLKTHPLRSDTDGDYFSDGYEQNLGWNPLVAGSPEQEHALELIHSIRRSRLLQEKAGLWTSDSIRNISLDDMIIEVVPGASQVSITFPLEVADSLGRWTPVPDGRLPVWVDDISEGETVRFYRIRYRSSYEPAMLNQNLVLHLPMNGNLSDASGHARHGVQDGDIGGVGSALSEDRFGQSDDAYLFYDTRYASIEVPKFPNQYQQLPELTLCVWVQINESYQDNRYIVGNFYWGNRHGWGLKLLPEDGFLFEAYVHKEDPFGNPFTWLGAYSKVYPHLGKWYHLAGQFSASGDTTVVRVYVDGILASTQSLPGVYPYRDGNRFGLGGDRARNQILVNARVDDVRVYDRLLSEAEIRMLARDLP